MAGDKNVSFTLTIKDAASAALQNIENAADRVTAKLFSFKDILTGLIATAGAVSLGAIIKDMVDLGVAAEATMNKIAAALPTFTEGLGALQDGIDALAEKTGNSLESLQQTAVQIAQSGASSAEQVQQRLEAATTFSDATGASLQESAQLLTQVSREFGVTGDDALEAMAKIAAAARGHVGIDELMTAFQRATPIFQKFGIDLDTGTRAIVALLQSGANARQVGTDLNQIVDKAGFETLASRAKIAGDSMDQLTQRAALVEDGAGRAGQKIKNELVVALERLAADIHLPDFLKSIADTLDRISKLNFGGLLKLSFQQIAAPPQWLLKLLGVDTNSLPGMSSLLGYDTSSGASTPAAATSSAGGSTRGTPGGNPMAGITTKADVEAMTKAQEEYNKAAAATNTIMREMAAQQKAADEALKGLGDELAKLSGDPLAEFDRQLADINQKYQEAAAKAPFYMRPEILAQLDEVNARYNALRPAVAAVSDAQQAGLQIQAAVASGNLDIEGGLSDLSSLLDVYKNKEQTALDPKQAEDYKKAVDLITQAMNNLGAQLPKTTPPKSSIDDLKVQALVIQQVVDGAIQLGEAFGNVDKNVGNVLRGLAQMAANIPSLVDAINKMESGAGGFGAVATAGVPILGALSTIVNSFMSAADAQRQAAAALQTAADSFNKSAQGYLGSGQGSVASQLAQNDTQLADLLAQYKDLVKQAATTAAKNDSPSALNVISGLPTPDQLKQQHDTNVQAIASTFYEGIGAKLNSLKGPAGDYQNALNQINQEYQQNIADADLLAKKQGQAGASAEQLAEITDLYNKEMQQATAAETERLRAQTANLQVQIEQASAYTLAEKQKADMDALVEQQTEELNQAIANGADDATIALMKTKDALAQTALQAQQAADALSAANSQIAQNADVYGTDATTQVGQYAAAYNVDLSAFDLTTLAGDQGAISYLQGLFGQIGDDDPTASVQRAKIQGLIDKIRNLPAMAAAASAAPSTASASSSSVSAATVSATGSSSGALTQISGAQADVISGMLATSNGYLAQIAQNTRSLSSFGLGLGNFSGTISATINIYVDNDRFDSFVRDLGSPAMQSLIGTASGKSLTRLRRSGGAARTGGRQ